MNQLLKSNIILIIPKVVKQVGHIGGEDPFDGATVELGTYK